MRTIIIGDVHGCDRALNALLEKVRAGEGDTLVLLGDLFDRGPDSWEVLQTAKKLAEAFGERFVLLRGNHEDYLLTAKLTLIQKLTWNRVGRAATVRSFKAHGARMEDAIPWLSARCKLFWRGEGVQCVHAGLMMEPIEVNDTQTLIHDHDITLRNLYTGALTVVGHIALEQPTWFAGDGQTAEPLPCGTWRALPQRGVICVDTGCGKGGRLTAMIVDGGKYRLEFVPEG